MSTMQVANRRLSRTIQLIPPSGIRRFFELASSMEGVISLGVGEPDFVTPWNTREAAIASLEKGYTAYTSNSGLYELREEICKYLAAAFDVHYSPDKEVVVTVGASEGIDLALRAILDPGDEVLVVEPCYVSYDPVVRLAGGVPVAVQTSIEQQFKLMPQHIEEKVTDRTKAIIFCFPNNPTGSIMKKEELAKLAEVVKRHDLIVISDEIYAELTYDTSHTSFASLPGMKERTILLSGFSKAFAMTGWRIGYAAGPEDIIQAMVKIHQYTMLCAPIMGQVAALESLRHGMEAKKRMVESYRQRRNYVVKAFEQIGLPCHKPEGAFYAFPSIASTGMTAEEFAEKLILEQKVAVVPGHVFGEGGATHIRCSYATSLENLEVAIDRMDAFLRVYK
ncbi:aminotransferase [Aneurinibacillus thermoaerophilus]|uniref:Aminotransferase n=1 Tax=Aneurinibacillus thermoaerophilus TaxID=143495 RepID=A0ABX8YBS2_ANETH|nr:aminotransferase [Aneurinibacillus thermoaerophilus]MED0676115.1 aminotransferase [Aneurinibacillus thermoaerophilus]MED0680785.1 aminotransferase [Aneurinibacillus thermoaerophilus]MED0738380.1 aminotransferase [Aneurinibacillus thermoaerophilus]MED0757652.1 aminotransferase [Aneurinibacillus thermoaerophilus]MED0759291.1 aminotransferase [Aneurinibacillus thermoaerophilus]